MNINLDPIEVRAITFNLLGLPDIYTLCDCAVLDMKKAVSFVGAGVLRRQKTY